VPGAGRPGSARGSPLPYLIAKHAAPKLVGIINFCPDNPPDLKLSGSCDELAFNFTSDIIARLRQRIGEVHDGRHTSPRTDLATVAMGNDDVVGAVAHLLLSGFAIDGVRLGRRGRVVFRFAPEAAPALEAYQRAMDEGTRVWHS
jgi:hypothetical protein